MAGWLPIFDYRYGTCIQAFQNPKSGTCQVSSINKNDFRSIISIRQIVEADKKSVSSAEGLTGKNFIVYRMVGVISQYYRYVSPRQRMTTAGSNETSEDFTFKDGLHCVGQTCSRLVRWSDGYLLAFDPKMGTLNAWWVEDK